jgi:long-chain acyl-CoA synthetase
MTAPEQPLHEHLRRHARQRPDRAAVIWYGRAISWRELDDWSDAVGAHLQSLGVAKGEPVALFMNNCPQYLLAHYASRRSAPSSAPAGR